jgi:hypothetical protein
VCAEVVHSGLGGVPRAIGGSEVTVVCAHWSGGLKFTSPLVWIGGRTAELAMRYRGYEPPKIGGGLGS